MPRRLTAAQVIAELQLAPHPEGGFYRETFRDHVSVAGRAASTAIYFLLPGGVVSRWHRVDAAEVWHWYAGCDLALSLVHAPRADSGMPLAAQIETVRLGSGDGMLSGARPQAVVPAGMWQQAESLGAWTLAGCTVAPGFSFDGFDIAPDLFKA